MKIEKQLCLHQQAEKLKALGIDQTSDRYFVNNWRNPRNDEIANGEHIITEEEQHITTIKGRERGTEVEFVSAFNVAELGQMLPDKFHSLGFTLGDEKDMTWFCRNEHVDTFPTCDGYEKNKKLVPNYFAPTEAQSRAGMLIHLLENKLWTAEQANERLLF